MFDTVVESNEVSMRHTPGRQVLDVEVVQSERFVTSGNDRKNELLQEFLRVFNGTGRDLYLKIDVTFKIVFHGSLG